MARFTNVVLTNGYFYNAAGHGGGPPKKRPDISAAQPYSPAMVDDEAAKLAASHTDPAEAAVIAAAATDLKARAAHFAAKGATVQAIAPVFPSEDRLFEVESETL